MPVLVGEWGAYGNYKETYAAAQYVAQQFEQHGFGDTYWDHNHEMESYDHFQAISRPFAGRIAGTLKNQAFDPESKTFTCEWIEDESLSAPTIIYLPSWLTLETAKIQLTPGSENFKITPLAKTAANIIIPVTGISLVRSLVIAFK